MEHSHNFVETYKGLVAFGMDRQTDENSVIYYLQKFSDDAMMTNIIKKLSDDELEEIFEFINRFLKNHLNDREYHALFLKDNHDHGKSETPEQEDKPQA
jgi:hypothetical protein